MDLRAMQWARFRRRYGFVVAVLTPILLWFIIFSFGPIIYALWASLTNTHTLDPSLARFVGFKNYISLLEDRRFLMSMGNVTKFVAVKGFLNILFSLGLALLLERLRYGRNVYLFFIFMPVVISQVAVAMLFLWLYDPRLGLINYLLGLVEIPPQSFIRSTTQAIYSVAVADVWKTYGYAAVIFLAGLLNIPQDYYEAAKVDGATRLQTLWRVTIPLLKNPLVLVMVLIVIDGVQHFTMVQVMTGGGPADSTLMPSILVYDYGLGANNYQMGYASSISILMFAVILIVTVFQLRLFRSLYE
jgi:ABC-type sugar transport system permease subunit